MLFNKDWLIPPESLYRMLLFLRALCDFAAFKVTENHWEVMRGNSAPTRAKTLPNSRGRSAPWRNVTQKWRKKKIFTSRRSTSQPSPPVGLVWLAVPVSPANETQPCQLRLHIVLLNEELNRLQLDGPVFLFGYRGTTEPILTADIQQIVSVCFCQIEAKLASVAVATYY